MFNSFSQPWRTMLRVAVALSPIGLMALCAIQRIPESLVSERRSTVRNRFVAGEQKLEAAKVAEGKYPAPNTFAADLISDPESRNLAKEFGSLPWEESSKDPFSRDTLSLVYATTGDKYILLSSGPDKKYSISPMRAIQGGLDPVTFANQTYDPTNGMFSPGDMWQMSE